MTVARALVGWSDIFLHLDTGRKTVTRCWFQGCDWICRLHYDPSGCIVTDCGTTRQRRWPTRTARAPPVTTRRTDTRANRDGRAKCIHSAHSSRKQRLTRAQGRRRIPFCFWQGIFPGFLRDHHSYPLCRRLEFSHDSGRDLEFCILGCLLI